MTQEETIAKIRRALRKGHPYREIAEMIGVSLGTVQKVKDTNALRFGYKKRSPDKQPYPQLGEHREALEAMLLKDSVLPLKKRRKWTRLYEALRHHGYQGKYDAVRRYASKWHPPEEDRGDEEELSVSPEACTPRVYRPGRAFEFDWSEERVLINGIEEKVCVAHFTLCHSRMKFMFAYRRQQLEMVLDAHRRAFEFFGGVCEEGIYDNMKTAVRKILEGKAREWNREFRLMSSFYCFEPRACTPKRGNEKGHVERAVQTNREDFFKTRPQVLSLEELNQLMEEECLYRARTRQHPEESAKTVYEMFLSEQPALMSFEGGHPASREKTGKSSKTLLVRCDNNHYSVNYTAANQPVSVRSSADRIVIFHGEEIVGDHERCFASGKILYHIEHYIPILKVKPGSIHDGLPYQTEVLPEGLARVRRELEGRKDFEKQFVGILSEVMEYGLDNVVAACELVLSEGPVSADLVKNALARSKPRPQEELREVDARLQLKEEPSSDCSEYDHLLQRDQDDESGRSVGADEGAEDEGRSAGLRRGCGSGCPSSAERGCAHPGTLEVGGIGTPVRVDQKPIGGGEAADEQKALGVQLQVEPGERGVDPPAPRGELP